jgi:hypothetical protein
MMKQMLGVANAGDSSKEVITVSVANGAIRQLLPGARRVSFGMTKVRDIEFFLCFSSDERMMLAIAVSHGVGMSIFQ